MGGKVHLRRGDDSLIVYGGLVAWDHFFSKTGLLTKLAANDPLPRTSPNATLVHYTLNASALNRLMVGTRMDLHMEWRKATPSQSCNS